MKKTFADSLRDIVLEDEMTRYAISKATGIEQSALCRFVKGERWLSEESINALAECLDLRIVRKRKSTNRRGHHQ